MLPPQLTPEERARALEAATQARRLRADVKSKVKSGALSVGQVFDRASHEPAIAKMRVLELLESQTGIGKIRAIALMDRLKISHSRRIQGLGVHQRVALLRSLDPAAVRGKLLVLSGPGGVGKSTVATRLKEKSNFWVSISATTRSPRATEKEGVDYYFLSEEEFEARVQKDEFLEYAQFAGARYGTPREGVENALVSGKNVLLEIEIEGARQVRAHSKEAILVFLSPPSWDELVARLEARGSDSPERRAQRLELARQEMAAAVEFDHVIVNDEVERVVEALVVLAPNQRALSGPSY
ncbi:MAG: guanylate kinase [Actinobacteria bacterium]|nr:guanylate kinase [Actinomycetota bacterium]